MPKINKANNKNNVHSLVLVNEGYSLQVTHYLLKVIPT